MNTATLKSSSYSSNSSLSARLDDLLGALLSVKPSVIAASFSEAMAASGTLGADELSNVSPQRVRRARQAMGLDA